MKSCLVRSGLRNILRLNVSGVWNKVIRNLQAAPRKARSMNAEEKISQNDLQISERLSVAMMVKERDRMQVGFGLGIRGKFGVMNDGSAGN